MSIRTKVRICQQAFFLPAVVWFRDGRGAGVECPCAAFGFRVYSRVSLPTTTTTISSICMTIRPYSIAKAYNSTKGNNNVT